MENNRIRELRKNLSLSQEALAEKIGTTQQAVSRMENNANDIPSDLLIEISKQFNVTTDYILGILLTKILSPLQIQTSSLLFRLNLLQTNQALKSVFVVLLSVTVLSACCNYL